MKELLVDYLPFQFDRSQLNESVKSGGPFLVKGILQRANSKNQNGRVYPRDVLVREVAEYDKKFVANKNALGELDHPDSSIVELKNASHNIREIKMDGDDVIGLVEVLPTPSGNILKAMFQSNVTLGISSRGLGSTKELEEGTVEVQDDFELIAFDFVSNPSTQGAFLKPINESVDIGLTEVEGEACNEWCKSHDIIRQILIELQK